MRKGKKMKQILYSVILATFVSVCAPTWGNSGPSTKPGDASRAKSSPSYQTGFYAGLHAGWGHMHGNRDYSITDNDGDKESVSRSSNAKSDSFDGALFAGYLIPFKKWALGIEGFFSSTPALKDQGKGDYAGFLQLFKIKRPWVWGVNFKPGMFFCKSRYFVYPLIGIESSRFEYAWEDEERLSTKKTRTGFSLGLGVEKQFQHFRLGLELKNAFYKTYTFRVKDSDDFYYNGKTTPRILSIALRVVIPFGGKAS